MEPEEKREFASERRTTPQRRTPHSQFKSVNSRFKSPIQSPRIPRCTGPLQQNLEEEIEQLRREQKELDSEIALLKNDGVGIQELEQHIDLLHEYNDIKDIGQTLLGKLAMLRGVTTRDLYSQFGLHLDD